MQKCVCISASNAAASGVPVPSTSPVSLPSYFPTNRECGRCLRPDELSELVRRDQHQESAVVHDVESPPTGHPILHPPLPGSLWAGSHRGQASWMEGRAVEGA